MHADNFIIGSAIDMLNVEFLDILQLAVYKYQQQLAQNKILSNGTFTNVFEMEMNVPIYNEDAKYGSNLRDNILDSNFVEFVLSIYDKYKQKCALAGVEPITCFFALEQYWDRYNFRLEI